MNYDDELANSQLLNEQIANVLRTNECVSISFHSEFGAKIVELSL